MKTEKSVPSGRAPRPMGSGEFVSLMLFALFVAPLAMHFFAGRAL